MRGRGCPLTLVALGADGDRCPPDRIDGGWTMRKLIDSWAGIGLIFVVLAALGAIWAQTTV